MGSPLPWMLFRGLLMLLLLVGKDGRRSAVRMMNSSLSRTGRKKVGGKLRGSVDLLRRRERDGKDSKRKGRKGR